MLAMKYWKIFCLGVLVVTISGCVSPPPILVGVAVEMSGNRGNIGIAIRNGAQLAVEHINENGGINGSPIELMVRDDLGDPEIAHEVDLELIDSGIVALIGHVTSEITQTVYDQIKDSGVILLSPTSSSPYFTGKKDNFFRVMPSNEIFGRALAQNVFSRRGIHEILVIYDKGNEAFSQTLWESIRQEFETLGGVVLPPITFVSGQDDLEAIMKLAAEINPEAIVFIASGIDTALMAQYGRLNSVESIYFSSTWAATDELIEKGGASVEGMELASVYDPNDNSEDYTTFSKVYYERFNVEPSLGASHGYEAILVLAEGLRRANGDLERLPEAISEIHDLQGVQGMISMDFYGDVIRNIHIIAVEGKEFITVQSIRLEDET